MAVPVSRQVDAYAAGRDIGVSRELQRDIFVVFTGLPDRAEYPPPAADARDVA